VEVRGTQVIVHLGRLPGYVSHYASMAAGALPEFDTVLVVDSTKLPKVPGVTVLPAQDLATPRSNIQIDSALSALGIDPHWRGGYWRRIFLRFELTDALMRSSRRNGAAVQLESDVMSSLSPQLLARVLSQMDERCYMPFIDDRTAGPGIMIATSPEGLSRACRLVLETLMSGASPSDMTALASDSGSVAPLPSRVTDSSFDIGLLGEGDGHRARIVFDAAATGQYLFGIDPRNNRGVIQPGYLETRGDLDPGAWADWRIILCDDGRTRVACTMESATAVFANIHMHSKVAVNAPSINDPEWIRTLSVANRFERPRSRIDLQAVRQIGLRRLLRG
jgi:hypothetical protein